MKAKDPKNKKTHKLSEAQVQELIMDFKEGRIDLKGAMQKYKISDQSARDYKRKAFVANAPRGRTPEVNELPEPEETQLEQPSEEVEELKREELLQDIKEKQENPSLSELEKQIDPSKDYCAECYRRGKIQEITKGKDTHCPTCMRVLTW